jgi:hypothetical protein
MNFFEKNSQPKGHADFSSGVEEVMNSAAVIRCHSEPKP